MPYPAACRFLRSASSDPGGRPGLMPSGDDGFCTGTPLVAAAPGLLVLVVQDYDAGT